MIKKQITEKFAVVPENAITSPTTEKFCSSSKRACENLTHI